MIFREFGLEECEGVLLAHTLQAAGTSLKKGRRLTAADAELLRAAGIERVAGARLEPDDLDEDQAAGEVARAISGENVDTRRPYTGRCNLHAAARGVLRVDREAIDRINQLDEAITVGTAPDFALARHAQVVATVKIIPFAVSRALVDAVKRIAADSPPVRLAPLHERRAALVLTELPGGKENAAASAIRSTRHRLEELGSRLALVLRCPHERAAVAGALREATAAGCDLLLVAGATVTKDRLDVVPAGIVEAGGEIVHFGMPVEPGNMLLLARLGATPVLNLPGCARSRRLNGLDWVLHRLLAGLPVARREIMAMGVGGLIRSPLEPEDDDEPAAEPARSGERPHVAAVILAAGSSRRMGAANKLLEPVGGIPMVRRVANAALASRCASVTAVTGHEADAVRAAIGERGVRFVHNPDYPLGLSTSLRRGLLDLPADADAALILLGDMPRIDAAHLDRLISAFDTSNPRIVVPLREGRRGNPILWPRRLFDEMRAVEGDVGARALLERHAGEVHPVAFDDSAIFLDVDTPDALAAARAP